MPVVDSPERAAHLRATVEAVRNKLASGQGLTWEVKDERAPAPVVFEVIPDGANAWIVHVTCGDRVVYSLEPGMCLRPDDFLKNLAQFLAFCLKEAIRAPLVTLN